MKKVLTLIAIIALPLLTVGQNAPIDTVKQNDATTEATPVQSTEAATVLSTATKAELNDLNYKKSNDIISIKAYRKSLQIKVKDIKNC